jgi:hypothetical protein
MIRRLEIFGLTVTAMIAATAMAASATVAAVEFHAESSPTFLTGLQTQINQFHFTAGTVSCTTATFTGQQVGITKAEVETEPNYATNCTAFGQTTHIDVNGCRYGLTASGNFSINAGKTNRNNS